MTRRPLVLVLLTLSLLLSACAPGIQPASSPARKPTPTAESLPAVSTQTTCRLLFGNRVDGPASEAVDIINRVVESADLTSAVTVDELESTIGSLQTARKNASDDLAPYIDAQITPLQQMADALDGDGRGTLSLDFADFKASAFELLTRCEQFL